MKIKCKLCKTCPFRPGNERLGWEPGAKTRLEAMRGGEFVFMRCHDSEPVDLRLCSGFASSVGHEMPAVQVALRLGWLKRLPRRIKGSVRNLAELDRLAAGAEGWT